MIRYLKKKIILLAVMVSVLSQGLAVYAEGSTYTKEIDSCAVRGILSSGNTLHFTYESEDGVADEDIGSCKWYKSTSLAGEYSEAGEGLTYQTTPTTAAEHYYAVATLINGESYTTDTVTVAGYSTTAYWPASITRNGDNTYLGSWPRENNAETQTEGYTATGIHTDGCGNYFEDVIVNSNADYMFEIDGQKFILVDTVDTSDTARYKVIAESTYGKEPMSAEGKANILAKMPEALTKHIDSTVYFEGSQDSYGSYAGGAVSSIYPVSLSDMQNYGDKVGIISTDYQTGEVTGYALNANSKARLDSGWVYAVESYNETTDTLTFRINASNLRAALDESKLAAVRPVFYLDKDFFAEVKLDTENMGSEIKELILNSYTREELSEIYPETDLEDVFGFSQSFEITSVNAVNSGENCNVTVNVGDNCGTDDVYLFAGLYNSASQLKTSMFTAINAELNGSATLNLTLNKNAESGDIVKCMIVDSTGAMNVFGRGYILEIE